MTTECSRGDWALVVSISTLIIHQIFFARAIGLNTPRDAAKTGEAHSFPRADHSRKTVRFSEQIMSADKYPCIFSRQMEAIVYTTSICQKCILVLQKCYGLFSVTGIKYIKQLAVNVGTFNDS